MRKLAFASGMMLFSVAALGQDAFQGANRDVLNALIFNARSEMKMTVTRTMPSSMAGFRLPAGFTLIGTGVRGDPDTRSTTVAFKTSLPADKAYAALVDAHRADGFAAEASQYPQTFNVPSERMEGTVCRNAERRALLVTEADGVRYASINFFPEQVRFACNAPDPRMANMGFGGMRAGMPKFNFPSTARMVNGLGGLGGGSNNTFATSTRIQSPDAAASLAEYLAAQLPAQGWRRDAAWNGSLSSGSTWKGELDGRPAWGSLEIVSFGEGVYEVGFVLQSR